MRCNVYYRLRKTTKLPLPPLSFLHLELRPDRNHSYCWVTRSAAAGVGNSETISVALYTHTHTLFYKRTPDARLYKTAVSWQLSAVNSSVLLYVFEIFKYETHLKSSCAYRGSIPNLE